MKIFVLHYTKLNDRKKHVILQFEKHNIIDYEFIVMNPAYVHITEYSNKLYNNWCNKNNLNNIYSIGRYGSWTYCSIEDNIIQAKLIAEKLNYE